MPAWLLTLSLLAAEPDAGLGQSCGVPTGARPTFRDYAKGKSKLQAVQVGWSVKRLRAHLGAPVQCDGDEWVYSAGHPDGPLVTFRFTVQGDTVRRVESSGAGCVLNQ